MTDQRLSEPEIEALLARFELIDTHGIPTVLEGRMAAAIRQLLAEWERDSDNQAALRDRVSVRLNEVKAERGRLVAQLAEAQCEAAHYEALWKERVDRWAEAEGKIARLREALQVHTERHRLDCICTDCEVLDSLLTATAPQEPPNAPKQEVL